MDAFWQRLDFSLRASIPLVSTLLFVLVEASAWPVPYLGMVMPSLVFIALFYWSAHRPDLFSSSIAFCVGLLIDIVHEFPLGLTALIFTCAHQILWRQRGLFTGHSFFILWAGFAIAATVVFLSQWILLSLIHWDIMPILPALTQDLLTIALFPLPCWFFIQIQRSVLSVLE